MIRESGKIDTAVGKIGGRFLQTTLEGFTGVFLLSFLFPVTDWGTLATVIAIFVIVALIMTRWIGLGIAGLILLGLFVATTCSVAALTLAPGTKYVVPVDSPSAALLATRASGSRGEFFIVPIYSAVPIKHLLLRAISLATGDFVFLESISANAEVIAHSPSEVAAASISRKPANAVGYISFPTRMESPTLYVKFKNDIESEIEASYKVSTIGPSFLSNVGPSSPGLFGIRSDKPFTVDQWRTLAFSEEFIRSLATEPISVIFNSLQMESDRTGSWSDFLRELTMRLSLMRDRYAVLGAYPVGSINPYELAVIGNLRFVAERFNARAPDKSLYGNPWLTELMEQLLSTIGDVPLRPLQHPDDKGSYELSWLVETLRKLAYLHKDNSLVSSLETELERSRVATNFDNEIERLAAAITSRPETLRADDFIKLYSKEVTVDGGGDSGRTGEDMKIAEFAARADSLTEQELVAWVKQGVSDRAWRVSKISDILFDTDVLSIGALIDQLTANPDDSLTEEHILDFTRRLQTRMAKLLGTYGQALLLIASPDERRLLQAELAIVRPMLESMKQFIDRAMTCSTAKPDAVCNMRDDEVLPALMGWSPDEFQALMRDVVEQDTALQQLRLDVPYSLSEYRYMAVLAALLNSTDITREDADKVCDDVRERASWLLLENRLAERAAVIVMQIEALRRCQFHEDEKKMIVALKTRAMPLASWQGQLAERRVWDSLRASPAT